MLARPVLAIAGVYVMQVDRHATIGTFWKLLPFHNAVEILFDLITPLLE
jgi:hypothetical protein